MKIVFDPKAWDEYTLLLNENWRKAKKVNELIEDIIHYGPLTGKGKPEALRNVFSGLFSRRIDEKNRLIYTILHQENSEEKELYILACHGHYEDK